MQKLKWIYSNRGSVLVFALVFGIVFSIIGIGTLRLISAGSEMHYRDVEIIKSYWANEGALRLAFRYISRINDLPSGTLEFSVAPALSINGKTPLAKITGIVTNGGAYVYSCSTKVNLSSVGLVNVTVCSSFTVNSMSRYTYFEKQMEQTGWARKIIYGDYHSNGYIRAYDYMTAEAHVTGKATTAGRINPAQQWDRPNYGGEYRMGIRILNSSNGDVNSLPNGDNGWLKTRFPDYAHVGTISTDLLEPAASSFDGAYSVTNNDSIALKLNIASVDIWKKTSGTWKKSETKTIASIPTGVIKTNRSTYVWGALDGRLTVVTDATFDIVLGGSIIYADRNYAASNDVLALVSGHDVVVPRRITNAALGINYDFTLSGADVDGSLFMPGGTLNVQNIDNYSSLKDLNIHGSFMVDQLTGTYNTQGGDHGIRGLFYQDPRFKDNSINAPGIPFARANDEELAGQFMWVLGNGTWKNAVSSLN
jgi:hypothetical protein